MIARTTRRDFIRLLTGVLLAGCRPARNAALPRGAVVVALGNSITAGYGVGPDIAWPAVLAGGSGWRIINAGVSGDTTAGGLERLPDLLATHKPDAVIVELGGNDMLRRVPDERVMANLEAIVALVRGAAALPILVATPRPSVAGAMLGHLSAASLYASVADKARIHLVADALPRVLSDESLKLDPLHPNTAGHARLAELLAADLRAAGLLG